MANITTYLEQILKAVFGKDVRSSIYNSIKAINSEVEGTTQKQNTLSQQFKNLVINAGNSNAEVAASRGSYDYLPDRLNAVDEQFNTKASKDEVEIERQRINNFTKLAEGSTTGDAELIDARIGADGMVYDNLGVATRTQFARLNEAFDSGVDIGIVTTILGDRTTDTESESCKTLIDGITQAYGNGFLITEKIKVVGIKLNSLFTNCTFDLYVFDNNNTMVKSFSDITQINKNRNFYFEEAIELNKGWYILMRNINSSGKYYYLNTGNKNLKEYQPGNKNLIDSPIRAGFEYIYEVVDGYKFIKQETTETDQHTKINLTDLQMPLCERTDEEGYTLLGRWFDRDETYKDCCNCGGQSIMFKLKGATTLSVDIEQIIHPTHPEYVMSAQPYFAYSIDGSNFERVQVDGTAKTISIPSTDEHFIWIVIDGMCLNSGSANRNSGWSGVYIKNISTDGTMYKVNPKSKQILFVGDSIVEGVNTLGTDSTSNSNSAINEFSFKTAQKLNAIPLLQGYGGSDSKDGIKWERFSYIDGQAPFKVEMKPNIIVIEYGYNDNSAISVGSYTKSDFINYYNNLLDMLRGHYTGVPIICMIPFKQSLAEEIRQIASQRSYCYVIETSDYDITYSDSAHPNSSGADVASDRLSKDIIDIFTKQYFLS